MSSHHRSTAQYLSSIFKYCIGNQPWLLPGSAPRGGVDAVGGAQQQVQRRVAGAVLRRERLPQRGAAPAAGAAVGGAHLVCQRAVAHDPASAGGDRSVRLIHSNGKLARAQYSTDTKQHTHIGLAHCMRPIHWAYRFHCNGVVYTRHRISRGGIALATVRLPEVGCVLAEAADNCVRDGRRAAAHGGQQTARMRLNGCHICVGAIPVHPLELQVGCRGGCHVWNAALKGMTAQPWIEAL